MFVRDNNITQERVKTFIEGHDPQERIVGLDYNPQDDYMTVIYRDELDRKCKHKEPFYPFIWSTRKGFSNLCNGNKPEISRLLSKYNIRWEALDFKDVNGVPCEKMNDGYLFLFQSKQPMSYNVFQRFFKECGCSLYSNSDSSEYLVIPPQQQFLIETGKRFFKGYDDYNQILRMTFDLETEGLDPKKHRIEWFGIRFNRPVIYKGVKRNYEVELELTGNTKEEKNVSELKLIDTALRIIYTFMPDVITAHNGENFDWNFIIERCKQLGSSIEQVSAPYFNGRSIGKETRQSCLKLGGETENFFRTIVPDITITDSLHAVRRAQATDSNFKKADLKYATQYLGLVKPNRVYTPGRDISKISNDKIKHYAFCEETGDWYLYDPNYVPSETRSNKIEKKQTGKQFILTTRNTIFDGYELVDGHYIIERYLADDLYECDAVEYSLNGTDFMMAKIMPVPFQKVITMGTAGQWKAIMMAWSYENHLAIPKPEVGKMTIGGLSRLLCVGAIGCSTTEIEEGAKTGKFPKSIIKLDYNSLYPSIILTWGLSNESDLMNIMLYMLEYVLTTRETHKKSKKLAEKTKNAFESRMNNGEHLSDAEITEYNKACSSFKIEDNRQACFKKLGNSFFGSLSASGNIFPWNSLKNGERTTSTGRQCLRVMIRHFSTIAERNNILNDLGEIDQQFNYQPIVGDTDGFNLKLPKKFRYTEEHPYISNGHSRVTHEGTKYIGYDADIAEFNDLYLSTDYLKDCYKLKMGLDADEVLTFSINVSRKNYVDFFPEKPYPEDIKIVGASIKSKSITNIVEQFLNKGLRLLVRNKGQEFLELYYEYIDKIYNYQIPLKDIASKGKVKKYLDEYIKDCQTITKAGRPKARQAWMELALRENLKVDLGDTLYYINIGKTKSQPDVKKVTHYYIIEDNKKKDCITKIEKEYKAYKKDCKDRGIKDYLEKSEFITKNYPNVIKEEEIILNAILLPREVVESEENFFCEEGKEYNVPKYIEQFNKRIKPLLVCFSKDIRDKILINKPSERPYFTEKESQLCSGQPNKPSDQDTYEQLMTMEDKEIKFWAAHPEFKIPFLEECGMNWDKIYTDYKKRMEKEKELGVDIVRKKYEETISSISKEDINKLLEEGELPTAIESIVDIDPITGNFVCKEYPDITIGSIHDIFETTEVEQPDILDNSQIA